MVKNFGRNKTIVSALLIFLLIVSVGFSVSAQEEIQKARDAIDAAQADGKDVSGALSKLRDAEVLAESGDSVSLRQAESLAIEARILIERYVTTTTFPLPAADGNIFIGFIVLVILIGIGSGSWYYYQNYVLPQQKAKDSATKRKRDKDEKETCYICGKKTKETYECKDCKETVDYAHARTYKKKTYCVKCLKRKGII